MTGRCEINRSICRKKWPVAVKLTKVFFKKKWLVAEKLTEVFF